VCIKISIISIIVYHKEALKFKRRIFQVLCTCYLAHRFNKHGIGARLRKEVINAELNSLNIMVDLMKFYYPSLFARGVHPKEQIRKILFHDFKQKYVRFRSKKKREKRSCCRNSLCCVAWTVLFSEGCSWFKLAASLEIFTLFLAANPEHRSTKI
jgi:hypothetical protein